MSERTCAHLTESKRTPGRAIIAARSSAKALGAGPCSLLFAVALILLQPESSIEFSASRLGTEGTGTRRLRRGNPTAFSTDPFSFPESGLQNLASKR